MAKVARKVNKHIFVWVGTFLFGELGVDRFLRGQVGLGICKLLFGWLTLGIWPLVDFIIGVSKAYGNSYGNVEYVTFDDHGDYIK
ncbi:TM2 domain-containing protein [Candidatus Saccharibacteria bacterium]|nr:TM2 domain-containing protein [Candidatus Saccharibacteria bacterium]